jgi:hypothetical protein
LPTIGNNDVKVHNQVPCSIEEANSYYGDMLELFFPATYTPTGMNKTAVNETFLLGGYYSYKIPNTDMTFIGLNTMYYKNEDNKCSYAFEIGDGQLTWLENQLKDLKAKGEKAMFGMHVFPGLNWYIDHI